MNDAKEGEEGRSECRPSMNPTRCTDSAHLAFVRLASLALTIKKGNRSRSTKARERRRDG